jgi:potassium-transporting ATPase potassium-binding subunit
MGILQIVITLLIFMAIVIPLGKYVYKVINLEKCFADSFFDRIDHFVYKICGIKREEMNWKQYVISLIVVNAVMTLFVYIVFRLQNFIGLNPNKIGNMEQTLSFHTSISFITNTNLQDYTGESGLSYLSQMVAITFLMFAAAASGFSAAAAFIRGITGRKSVGNFFVDLVRIITRILMPLAIVVSLLLMLQGVPQSLSPNRTITTIEGKMQDIPLGPVASLEAIKQLGTNGGGFFGANSAHPFENPTPFANLLEILSMMILPGAIVIAFGHMLKNKKQAMVIFAAMFILLIVSLSLCYSAEKAGNPVISRIGINQSIGNMEGKEIRFGVAESSLFTTVTTAFTTGAVNTMHDSLTPLGGMAALWQMMINVVFGGKGVGFMNMIMYAILTVFIAGLMVGRTPEFLGKKIEAREIKLIAVAILIHPFIILMPTAFSLINNLGLNAITNPGFHGLTQILYQYTSAAANNGSNFAGIAATTPFWNITTGIVMFIGRYFSIIILLAVAGSLANKKAVAAGPGTFRTDNTQFVWLLIIIVIIIGALTFFPALALGPIAEHLTL